MINKIKRVSRDALFIINNMLVLCIVYIILFVSGYHLSWLSSPYDELRVIQLILVFSSFMFLSIFKQVKLISSNDYLLNIIFLVFSLLLINFKNIFQVYDLVMWLGMWIIFFCLLHINYNKKINELILTCLVVISVFPCLFLPIVIFEFINSSKMYDWQMNSGSVRIYDSFIIPIFWIAVHLKCRENQVVSFLYPVICFFITLALFMDGARSALLSIVIPLVVWLIIDKANRKVVLFTFIYLILAFVTYKLTFIIHNYFSNQTINLNIARFSTSYRYEIWLHVFDKWLESPFLGVGGGYLAEHHFKYGHHMHNVYLRLIFEWGALGVILLAYFFYKLYFLFKSDISIVLKMGVLAILIDAAFSGNFIYPASQVACVLLLAMAFSEKKVVNLNVNYASKLVFLIYGIIFTFISIYFIGQDFICFGCSSAEGRAAPFFWEYGGSKGLTKE